MIGRRVVAVVAALGLMALGSLASPCGWAAAAPRPPGQVLHLRWRLVSRGSATVAASDRYVAVVEGYGAAAQVTLIDEQPSTRQTLAPPDCWVEAGLPVR